MKKLMIVTLLLTSTLSFAETTSLEDRVASLENKVVELGNQVATLSKKLPTGWSCSIFCGRSVSVHTDSTAARAYVSAVTACRDDGKPLKENQTIQNSCVKN